MGKWLPGRIQRIGRDGEVDLILDDGTELENVPEERLRESISPNHALILRLLLNVEYHVIQNARPPMVYHLVHH